MLTVDTYLIQSNSSRLIKIKLFTDDGIHIALNATEVETMIS